MPREQAIATLPATPLTPTPFDSSTGLPRLTTTLMMMSIPAIAQETTVAIKTSTPGQTVQPFTAPERGNLKGKLQPVEISIALVQEKQKQEPDRLRQVAESGKVNPAVAAEQPEPVTLIKVSF